MSYLKFFTKRALKNPLTIVTISLTLILVMITLAMNIKTYKSVSLSSNAQQNLAASYHLKKVAAQDLKKTTQGSERHEIAKENYSDAVHGINENLKLINDLKIGHYQQAYKVFLKQNNSALKSLAKDSSTTPELLTGLKRESLRLKALEKGKYQEQSEDYPIDALGFLVNSFKYVLPVLLTVIMVFVLSQTFSERFSDKVDFGGLFPFKRNSISFADLAAGFLVSFGLVTLISIFIFTITGTISGFGHWNYPIFTYIAGSSTMKFISMGSVLLKTVPLGLLFLLFTVTVCNLVSILSKNRLVSLFVSIVVLIALPLTTWVVIPLQSIAYYLPTTYLFSELTVTGELSKAFDNYQLTSTTGYIVLSCAILLILGCTWLIDWHQNK